MRRLTSLTIGLISTLAISATLATAADALVVGHLRVATESNATVNASYTAGHEQVVILQPWETAELAALKAQNPGVKVLMYQDASAASDSVGPNGLYATGVSYAQAAANGWLLDNTGGQPFTFDGYSWLWAADVGLPDYQSAWAANVLRRLDSGPWDGVFIDDVNPTIYYHYCVTCVAKYPSDTAYGAAMGSFVQSVGPKIQAAGKLAVANIGSWPAYTSVVDPWLRYLSGAMDEQFLKWGSTPGTGYQAPATWATQLGELKLAESENKLFLGITHSSNTDEQAAVYGYATELLGAAGHSDFYMGADYTGETWFPEYDYDLGNPTGAYSVDANGVYRRAFSSGLVLVNPTTSSQTVSLGGTYSGSGLTNATTATLPPQSGLVLTLVAPAPSSAPTPTPSSAPTPAPSSTPTPAPTPAPSAGSRGPSRSPSPAPRPKLQPQPKPKQQPPPKPKPQSKRTSKITRNSARRR